MAFEQRLKHHADAIERRLAELLSEDAGPWAPPRLRAAMKYSVLGGGKRFRPFLVFETAALFGLPAACAIDAAAAVECLHCYSLVHDDLPAMDNDDLRRGQPTVHRKFDEATAILAGDTVLTLAFEILARPSTHIDADVRAELVLRLARASGLGGMAGGQMLDLEAEHTPQGLEQIRRIQQLKTGALIAFACETGAILARAGDAERQALIAYGRALGLAFQISDDLLDAEGDAAQVGKATKKDASQGKATFVSLLGVAKSRAMLADLEADATRALALFGHESGVLAEAARFVSRRRS